jgi:hypothetical protein
MCDQILDMSMFVNPPGGNNKIVGWQGVCNPIPESMRQAAMADHETKMFALGENLQLKLGKRPGAFGFKFNQPPFDYK